MGYERTQKEAYEKNFDSRMAVVVVVVGGALNKISCSDSNYGGT